MPPLAIVGFSALLFVGALICFHSGSLWLQNGKRLTAFLMLAVGSGCLLFSCALLSPSHP